MPERNELITVCRQIGGMMEAGVDILRITRVLRAQTDTPRLLQLYDSLDRDLTMGRSLAEAMSRAPDVFSPFAVQMIQQGEARNDLAGAFLKVADFLKQEQDLEAESALREISGREVNGYESSTREADRPVSRAAPHSVAQSVVQSGAQGVLSNAETTRPDLLPTRAGASSPLTVIALDGLMDRLQTFLLRALTIMSGLMLSLASVWWLLELGYIEKRWELPLAFSMTAVFLGGAGIFIQRRIRADRRREARCSFCGRQGIDLQRAPRFAGAAICSRCAAIVAKNNVSDAPTTSANSSADSPDHDDLKHQTLKHEQPIDTATAAATDAATTRSQARSSTRHNEVDPKATSDTTNAARDDLNDISTDGFSNSSGEESERGAQGFADQNFAENASPISPDAAASTKFDHAKSVRVNNGNRAKSAGVKPLMVDEEDYE